MTNQYQNKGPNPIVGVSSLKKAPSKAKSFLPNTGNSVTLYMTPEQAQALLTATQNAIAANPKNGIKVTAHVGKTQLPDTATKNAGGVIDNAFLVVKGKAYRLPDGTFSDTDPALAGGAPVAQTSGYAGGTQAPF